MKQRVLSIKDIPVHVEIADDQESRQQGLMNRDHIPNGSGMLFIFPEKQTLGFWMKNTRVPLSIAFISSENKILNIEEMYPYDMTTIKSSEPALCALEVPSGWFKRNGIFPGDVVNGIGGNLISESSIRKIIRGLLL